MHTLTAPHHAAGHAHAIAHLQRRGYTVLERTPAHDFDHDLQPIIARYGAALVLVMTRAYAQGQRREITDAAVNFMRHYARPWLTSRPAGCTNLRIDVLELEITGNGQLAELEHAEGAIRP